MSIKMKCTRLDHGIVAVESWIGDDGDPEKFSAAQRLEVPSQMAAKTSELIYSATLRVIEARKMAKRKHEHDEARIRSLTTLEEKIERRTADIQERREELAVDRTLLF